MTGRIPLDHLTSDQLDQMYTRLQQLEELLDIAHATSNKSEAERARAQAKLDQVVGLRDALNTVGGDKRIANRLTQILNPPPPIACARCRDTGRVPNWQDQRRGDPRPKPCPDCKETSCTTTSPQPKSPAPSPPEATPTP